MDFSTLALLAATASGILTGALLTEAFILVPYWKKMEPSEFLRFHPTLAPLLFRFYMPVTVAGTALPIIACIVAWLSNSAALWLLSGSAACAIAMLGVYFGYFQKANLFFATSESAEESVIELGRWAAVHNARTVVAVTGFVLAEMAVLSL